MSRRTAFLLMLVATFALCLVGGSFWWVRATSPANRLRKGRDAARHGDFEQAEHYAESLRSAAADDHLHLLKADIAFRRNRPNLALDHTVLISPESPLAVEAALLSAQCLIALRLPKNAANALEFVLQRDAENVVAMRWLAAIYYDQGDLLQTITLLERIRDLDPADSRSVWLLGTIHRDLDKLDEAIAAFRESLRREPHPVKEIDLRVELAECLFKQQSHADVLQALHGFDASAAVALKFEALVGLGQAQEAIALLDTALAKDPAHLGLLRLRGEHYLQSGDIKEAVRVLEAVVRESPSDFRSRTNLALAYEQLGRSADAEVQHQKVKETLNLFQKVHDKGREAMNDPWDGRVRLEMAELCERIDRPELARMWRRAAEACRTPNL